ncbi:MAG: hypothetical protein ABI072_08645, partial [Edaphobacter sp.]
MPIFAYLSRKLLLSTATSTAVKSLSLLETSFFLSNIWLSIDNERHKKRVAYHLSDHSSADATAQMLVTGQRLALTLIQN